MNRYNSYRSYLRKKFGKPVLKIPVNGGFSCPNRDGTLSVRGCAFCDNRSFSPVAVSPPDMQTAFEHALSRAGERFGAVIAYLQPFTNTHGPVSRLKEVYEPLIAYPEVVGLSIGTRPDCLSPEVCDYLAEITSRTYLSVELGLQSAVDQTLRRVNRGHCVADFEGACERLADRGIYTVAHVMLGLPGERPEDMCRTAERLASWRVGGVKVHQTMVIRGTALEEDYRHGLFEPLTLERYVELVAAFLARLRPDQHIHRLVADSRAERGLIAPRWSEEKLKAVEAIGNYLAREDIRQGTLWDSDR